MSKLSSYRRKVMKKSRICTALLMTSLLMSAALTGCGSATGSQSAQSQTAAKSEESKADTANDAKAETSAASAENQASGASVASGTGAEFVPALDTGAELTINFVGGWGNFEALDQVALDFQKYYPDVEIAYSKLDDVKADILNRFATGEGIDIFMNDYWKFKEEDFDTLKEYAEDLNESGIDLSSIDQNLLKVYDIDGYQAEFPLYNAVFGYMINEDIFESVGVSVPTTYEELKDCCEKLMEAGYEHPFFMHDSYNKVCFMPYYWHLIDEGKDPEAAFTEMINMAEEFNSLPYIYDVTGEIEDNYNALILRFFEGDVPMAAISTTNFSGTKKREAKSEKFTAEPFKYDFAQIALTDEPMGLYENPLATLYVGVYKNSPNLDYANEFLRFMYSQDEMKIFERIKNQPVADANVGYEDFPLLEKLEKVTGNCSTREKIRIQYAGHEAIKKFKAGTDNAEAWEAFREFLK